MQESQIPSLYSIILPLNNYVLSADYVLNQKQNKNKLCLLEIVNRYYTNIKM